MTVRVPFESLPEELKRALEAGETVTIEREGKDYASAARGPKTGTVDYDDFIADIEAIRRELNRGLKLKTWES